MFVTAGRGVVFTRSGKAALARLVARKSAFRLKH
jgi:hypothetical protein